MIEEGSILTWPILKEFGFSPDSAVISEGGPGLSFDFGDFRLSASRVKNLRFKEVVAFGGVWETPRRIADLSFEMPRQLASREQCAAWIAWHLDQVAGAVYEPSVVVPWLHEGRRNLHMLPWEREQAVYAARPCCTIKRDWARVAIKTLAEHLISAIDDDLVTLAFDGSVLTFRCGKVVVALPGEGNAWPVPYAIAARQLRNLPKRFMQERIAVSVFESRLTIGSHTYSGIAEVGR